MIAPEPISPGPVTRSVYDDAVLGPEAPAIVLTSGATAASSPGEGEPIAPTADGDAVNGFGAGQVPDLPPITITDDIWCFFPRLGHDAVGLVNNWNNLTILGVALGGSLAIRSEWDGDVRNWTAEHPDRWGEGSKIIGDFGVAQYQIPFLLGGYLYTVYAQDYYHHDMMYSMISAYTLFGLTTVSIKYIADTNRPSDTWNGGKLGFPSWHDGSMFCIAAVLDDYEGHWVGSAALRPGGTDRLLPHRHARPRPVGRRLRRRARLRDRQIGLRQGPLRRLAGALAPLRPPDRRGRRRDARLPVLTARRGLSAIIGTEPPEPIQMRRNATVQILARHLPELRRDFGVSSLSLFGSLARDEAHETSDVDVLVDFDRPVTLFDLVSLQLRLEQLLNVQKVDVIVRDALHASLRENILREAIHVG